MRNLSILGSTGSIGTQTLEVIRENGDVRVAALAAYGSVDLLEQQVREFSPELVCVYHEEKAADFSIRVRDLSVRVVSGMEGLIECALAPGADMVVSAVVGMIGIRPVMEAIRAGKDIALANKETLVTAGHLIMPLVKEHGVRLLPIDSEHSAIFQALQGSNFRESLSYSTEHGTVSDEALRDGSAGRQAGREVEKLILTASGGPFRGRKWEELRDVTVEQALRHPNWRMGRKITVDSATMVNKGLEVMEARWLFGVPAEKIEVVIQPQSIIHSAVEFVDGAILAQLGTPDMRLPIQYAVFYPERRYFPGKRLSLTDIGSITFEKPDYGQLPGLRLALSALEAGGSMPVVFNAANEYAVARFLERKIRFTDITTYIERAMQAHRVRQHPDLAGILEAEQEAYQYLEAIV